MSEASIVAVYESIKETCKKLELEFKLKDGVFLFEGSTYAELRDIQIVIKGYVIAYDKFKPEEVEEEDQFDQLSGRV